MTIVDLDTLGSLLADLEGPILAALHRRSTLPARPLDPRTIRTFLERRRLPWEELAELDEPLLQAYGAFLPTLCPESGRAIPLTVRVADLMGLDALSRRIHLGAFHAARLKSDLAAEVCASDEAGALALLTRPEVEAAILARVFQKAQAFAPEAPERLAASYRHIVFPLTKQATWWRLRSR